MGSMMKLALKMVVVTVAIFAVQSGESSSCKSCSYGSKSHHPSSSHNHAPSPYHTPPSSCNRSTPSPHLYTPSSYKSRVLSLYDYPPPSYYYSSPPYRRYSPSSYGYAPSSYNYPPPSYYYSSPPYRRYPPSSYGYTPSSYNYPPPSYYYSSPPYPRYPPSYYYSSKRTRLSKGSLVGIIIGVVAFLWLVVLVFALVWRKVKYPATVQPPQSGYYQEAPQVNQPPGIRSIAVEATVMMRSSCAIFTYEELKNATNGFSHQNLLGRGAFGDVHRGILSDGTEVAIKQLNPESWQGKREFRTEVEIISRVHHNHLVKLVGYCSDESRKLLVYELVPNGTLESHLHNGTQGFTMDWSKRMKVALGCVTICRRRDG